MIKDTVTYSEKLIKHCDDYQFLAVILPSNHLGEQCPCKLKHSKTLMLHSRVTDTAVVATWTNSARKVLSPVLYIIL